MTGNHHTAIGAWRCATPTGYAAYDVEGRGGPVSQSEADTLEAGRAARLAARPAGDASPTAKKKGKA